MTDLTTPLSDDEQARLGDLLLNRIDEDAEEPGEEGILDVSELDVFMTAIAWND